MSDNAEWVELLWDLAMSGNSDMDAHDGSTAFYGFTLNATIAGLTGYLEDSTQVLVLWESDDGNVGHSVMSDRDFDFLESYDFEDMPTRDFEVLDPDFDDLGEAGW